MAGYLLRRLTHAVFVIWGAFTITFLLLYLLPSDPISLKLSQEGATGATGSILDNPEIVAALKARYGFDRPVPEQYAITLLNFVSGDLGTSINTGIPVAETLAQAVPQTILLAGATLPLSLLLGTLVAIASTYSRARWLRQLFLCMPPVGMSLPVFWVGLLLLQIFSFRLNWFPAMGNGGFASLVLPTVTLALPVSSVFAQVLAKGLFDVLGQPYIHVARAKGLSRLRVHLTHAFRNAAIPALTVIGLAVGYMLAGAVIVETVFSRAGVGRVINAAVNAQDIPVVLAVVVLSSTAFAATNLAVDLIYPLLDPRIRRKAA